MARKQNWFLVGWRGWAVQLAVCVALAGLLAGKAYADDFTLTFDYPDNELPSIREFILKQDVTGVISERSIALQNPFAVSLARLSTAVTYKFTVRAVGLNGLVSSESNTLEITVPGINDTNPTPTPTATATATPTPNPNDNPTPTPTVTPTASASPTPTGPLFHGCTKQDLDKTSVVIAASKTSIIAFDPRGGEVEVPLPDDRKSSKDPLVAGDFDTAARTGDTAWQTVAGRLDPMAAKLTTGQRPQWLFKDVIDATRLTRKIAAIGVTTITPVRLNDGDEIVDLVAAQKTGEGISATLKLLVGSSTKLVKSIKLKNVVGKILSITPIADRHTKFDRIAVLVSHLRQGKKVVKGPFALILAVNNSKLVLEDAIAAKGARYLAALDANNDALEDLVIVTKTIAKTIDIESGDVLVETPVAGLKGVAGTYVDGIGALKAIRSADGQVIIRPLDGGADEPLGAATSIVPCR